MSPGEIAAGYGVEVVAGPSPSAAAYVQGIMDFRASGDRGGVRQRARQPRPR